MRTVGVILVVLLVAHAGATVDGANIARDAIGGDWSTAVESYCQMSLTTA